jgi:hypothetical protein
MEGPDALKNTWSKLDDVLTMEPGSKVTLNLLEAVLDTAPNEIKQELMMPEWDEVRDRLKNLKESDIPRLISEWRKLPCANANLTCFTLALTTLLQSNTAPYLLGVREASRAASFYLVKYMAKDFVALSASLSILVDVKRHTDRFPSRAEDAHTPMRDAMYFLQRACNVEHAEMLSTQAAALLQGLFASITSESFTYTDHWSYVQLANQLMHRDPLMLDAGKNVYGVRAEEAELEGEEEDEDEGEYVEIAGDNIFAQQMEEVENHGVGEMRAVKTYRTKEGDVKPISTAELYLYRGPALAQYCAVEYEQCVHITQKTEKQLEKFQERSDANEEDLGAQFLRGRSPNAHFEFHPASELHGIYHQTLVSKVRCNVHVGLKMPREPKQLGRGKAVSQQWLRRYEIFAAFMVANFVPWSVGNEDDHNGEMCQPPNLTPAVWLAWYQHLTDLAHSLEDSRERTIARGRLFAIQNFVHGISVNTAIKDDLTQYRFRNASRWDKKKKDKGAEAEGDGEVPEGLEQLLSDLVDSTRASNIDPQVYSRAAHQEDFVQRMLKQLGVAVSPPFHPCSAA